MLFNVWLVKHDLQDKCSALIYHLLESKMLTMLSTNTNCSKKQGKVAVFQAGLVMETIDCYWTVITISIELGMVKAEQYLDS